VATAEVAAPAPEPQQPSGENNGGGMSSAQKAMFATFRDAAQFDEALGFREGQLGYIAEAIGRRIESRKELSDDDARQVTTKLRGFIAQSQPAGDAA
jgi:hypothetical protein